MSDSFALHLREALGLSAGARVALQSPNSLVTPVAAFVILKMGRVLVNVKRSAPQRKCSTSSTMLASKPS